MHGEAVAIGMVQVTKVAEAKGLVQAGLTQAIRQMCQKFGLPVEFHTWDKEKALSGLNLGQEGEGQSIETRFGT